MARRYILQALAFIPLLLLVGAGVGLAVFQARDGKVLSVQTGSMEPAIEAGSMVLVNRIPTKDIRVGDVITYINPANSKQTITHRVVQIVGQDNDPKQIIAKGDANALPDNPVSPDRIVGKVGASVPYAGRTLDVLRTWPGIIGLVYIPALIVVGHELRKLTAYYRSQQPYISSERLWAYRRTTGHLRRNVALVGILSLSLLAVVPVRAALQQTITLSGNSVSNGVVSPGAAEGSIMLRRVFVVCSQEDPTVASMVRVTIYNAGRQNASIDGWQFMSGEVESFTFPPDTTLLARRNHDFEFLIPSNLSYSEGSLELRDADGTAIDHETWDWAGDQPCRFQSLD